MSWIFGAGDPSGIDERRVIEAAQAALPGQTPILELTHRGDAVMGGYDDDIGPGILRVGRHLMASDARVDAVGDVDAGSVEGAHATALVWEQIRTRGMLGLDDLAADFTFSWYDEGRGRQVLARDATANRPLYWMSDGDRWAFASSARFLLAYQEGTSGIDPKVCARFLAGIDFPPERTGLRGVHRVLGGHWLVLPGGGPTGSRWFHPEWDPVDRAIDEESVGRVRDAIRVSVRDRARAGRVGLWLSGGRDSGSIAEALRHEGISADCYTFTFDSEICTSEDDQARTLAVAGGHRWFGLRQSPVVRDEDLAWYLGRTSIPLGMPYVTSFRESHEEVMRRGTTVSMEGFGGELFVANPVITGGLVRSMHIGKAIRSARAFRNNWVYGYGAQAKTAFRAGAPRWLLDEREGMRPLPPWARSGLRGRLAPGGEPRTARDFRPWFLLWEGRNGARDPADSLTFPDGIRNTYPFYDRRVIRAALRLPVEALIPHPEPKWILRDAILGSWAETRVKATQVEWFRAVARGAWETHAGTFSPRGRLAQAGLVDPAGMTPPYEPAWEIQSSNLVFTEAAIRALDRLS